MDLVVLLAALLALGGLFLLGLILLIRLVGRNDRRRRGD
jgi:hypothetical protein